MIKFGQGWKAKKKKDGILETWNIQAKFVTIDNLRRHISEYNNISNVKNALPMSKGEKSAPNVLIMKTKKE